MLKYLDTDGVEKKSNLGDGELRLNEYISWSGTTTDVNVPLFIAEEDQEVFESAGVAIQMEWIPDEPVDNYEAPVFD
mgnify:CR=1 FL=1|jgi:hypothetical protein